MSPVARERRTSAEFGPVQRYAEMYVRRTECRPKRFLSPSEVILALGKNLTNAAK
jgi:hypothetical protein